jgi:putative ABC transport system permease protein
LQSGSQRRPFLRLLPRLYFGALTLNHWLGMLGVAIGVANIIGLISVTEAGRWQAMGMLRDAGSDTVFVFPFIGDEPEGKPPPGAGTFLPNENLEALRGLPQLSGLTGILLMPGHVGLGAQRQFTTLQGCETDYLRVRGHAVAQGRFFSPRELDGRARVCTLGSELAASLFAQDDPLGQEIAIKGQRFEVIGVMVPKGMIGFENMDLRAFLPLSTQQELYSISGVHSILAQSTAGISAKAASEAVEARLREHEGLKPGQPADFSTATVDELTGILDKMLRVFRYLLYGISSVALFVAGIGIMNVMLMQVIERTREIGVRRAVGARRRDIWRQFMLEAIAQSLSGALLGMLIGAAGAAIFCRLVDWQPYLSLQTVLTAAGFSLATGIVFGVYPAVQAARLKPIDCLRYE